MSADYPSVILTIIGGQQLARTCSSDTLCCGTLRRDTVAVATCGNC